MPFDRDLGLYFTDEGEGEPVILVHGFALSHDLWSEQRSLAEEFLEYIDAGGIKNIE